MSKFRHTTMFFASDFNCWNAFSQTGVQTKSLFRLSKGLNGALTSASLGKNLCKLCIEPIEKTSTVFEILGLSGPLSLVFFLLEARCHFPQSDIRATRTRFSQIHIFVILTRHSKRPFFSISFPLARCARS